MEKANIHLTHDEIQNIIEEIDYFGNGQINYSEFLSATISVQSILNHDRLVLLFK